MPWRTTGGPATKSCETSLTITEKWAVTTRAAPSPATGPRQAAATGILPGLPTTTSQPGLAGR
jgi:hypothetical protein